MIRYQVDKDDKYIFNLHAQQIQKMKNPYHTKGPKGSEVRESNTT